jgi:hypothetical protein
MPLARGTISFWAKPLGWSAGSDSDKHYLLAWENADGHYFRLYMNPVTGPNSHQLKFEVLGSDGSVTAISTSNPTSWTSGTWYFVRAYWDFQSPTPIMGVSIGSDAYNTTTIATKGPISNPNPSLVWEDVTLPTAFYLGTNSSAGEPFEGVIDELRILDYPQTGTSGLVFHETFDDAAHIADMLGTLTDPESVVSGGMFSHFNIDSPDYTAGLSITGDERLSYTSQDDNNFNKDKGTIEFWVKPDWDGATLASNRAFFLASQGSGVFTVLAFSTGQGTATLRFRIKDANGNAQNVDASVLQNWVAGEWHHVVAYWDMASQTRRMGLIVDGVPSGEATPPAGAPCTPATMYVGSYGSLHQSNATIDDFRIYNDVLTDGTNPPVHFVKAYAIPTYHSIGIYWPAIGGGETIPARVEWRKAGVGASYVEAHPLWYDKFTGEYRGSIVHMAPDTVYDVRLRLQPYGGSTGETLETFQVKTWDESPPTDAETVVDGDQISAGNGRLEIVGVHGSPTAWKEYDGYGSTIDVLGESNPLIGLIKDSSYVIVRNLNFRGATDDLLRIKDSHHVIIEDCELSRWGSQDTEEGESPFAAAGHYAIALSGNGTRSVTVQRCKIFDPNFDSNSWYERTRPSEPGGHPRGAIAIHGAGNGNNVFRYNEILSSHKWDSEEQYPNYYQDGISGPQSGYKGSSYRDSDIYGNYIQRVHDDAIQSEGANMNVRIFGNYTDKSNGGIAVRPTGLGPVYVFRNVHNTRNEWDDDWEGPFEGNEKFLKVGYNGEIDSEDHPIGLATRQYYYNNTMLQPGGSGGGFEGLKGQGTNMVIKNNVFHVDLNGPDPGTESLDNGTAGSDGGYNLCNGFDQFEAAPGSIEGTPTYEYPTWTGWQTGGFALLMLSSGSDGYGEGDEIENFTTFLNPSGPPDMGAHGGPTWAYYGRNAGASYYDSYWYDD